MSRSSRAAIVESLARLVKPGGRVVITCDVDLRRADALLLEDAADVLMESERHFELQPSRSTSVALRRC